MALAALAFVIIGCSETEPDTARPSQDAASLSQADTQARVDSDPSPTATPHDFSKVKFSTTDGLREICFRFSPERGGSCEAFEACRSAGIEYFEDALARTPESNRFRRVLMHSTLGSRYQEQSDKHAEIAKHLTAAYELDQQLLDEGERPLSYSAIVDDRLLRAAAAHMRLGEVRNCLLNHNAKSCLFPLSVEAQHVDREGSLAALKLFRLYLERNPDAADVKWLVNVIHQTLGSYPRGVDPRYLISAERYATSIEFPRFENIAIKLGLTMSQMSGAAVIDDFNNDGNLDIILSSMGVCDPTVYFESDGHGGFVDKSAESNIASQLGSPHILQADFDNDGWLDIYVTRAPWRKMDTAMQSTLLKNQGNAHFIDVTDEVGLGGRLANNIASIWGDFNNDGWIDLFVCNESASPDLFLNEGGKFRNVIARSGIENSSVCKGAAWGDVNNDGWIDLFLSNWKGDNRLYINQGDGTFEQSHQYALEKKPDQAFSAWFWDYDNDGWLDLFVGGFELRGGVTNFAKELAGAAYSGESDRIFRNLGQGRFQDVTAALGVEKTHLTMGANYGDLDNDGFSDFYVGTGSSYFSELVPNLMYKNQGGQSFVDVTTAGGFGNLQKGHGVAFGDLDNDGDQDVLIQLGGAFPADRYFPNLFLNPGFGNNWLTLRLRGVKSNRSAIGSRVHVRFTDGERRRSVYKLVGSGGNFGSNSLQVELGIGKAEKVDLLEITWAGNGHVDRYTDVAANQILSIVEGNEVYEVVDQATFSLGGNSGGGKTHRHGDGVGLDLRSGAF